MRLLFLFVLALTFTSPVLANNTYVENVAMRIHNDLKGDLFEKVEKQLATYIKDGTTSRHGTDIIIELFDEIILIINKDESHKDWDRIEDRWAKEFPKSFLNQYFDTLLKYSTANHYTHPDRVDSILQSQRRRYKDTMATTYNRFLRLTEKFPDEWRIHAHLTANFKKYKLSREEVKEHFLATQSIEKGEVNSLTGYIMSLSPFELGRDERIISQGIANILRKYPDRNLSKPEYIDERTKQEIEDEIFELSIGQILLTARQYIEKSDKQSAILIAVPKAYNRIFADIQRHYKNRPEKIKKHPLSLERKAVWNEIEDHYSSVIKKYPNSGRYLTDYLKLSLQKNDMKKIDALIKILLNNDPNYKPAEIAPIKCEYFGNNINDNKDEKALSNLYKNCKTASRFTPNESILYRTAWAARQLDLYKESNSFLERILDISPNDPLYLTDMCWNFKDLENYKKALDLCDRAITQDRTHARAWLGRSHVYYYGFNNLEKSQKDAKVYKTLLNQQQAQQ
ncbi:MAG: hypothetical protein AB8B83_02555 [Bdellovibrionales bacterium]